MSWQVDGACYATQHEAVQAAIGSEIGKVVTIGSVSYIVDVPNTTSTLATYVFKRVSGTPDITKTVSLNVKPCGLMTWQDGVQVGWLLIAAWAAAYGVRYLARAFKT